MEKVDYDARLHAVYAAGREISPAALDTWMEAFARHLPETRPLVWLDLGSGTGRMTPSLASSFGGPVHGVEPSDKMRAQAIAHAGHPHLTYAAGSAEHRMPDVWWFRVVPEWRQVDAAQFRSEAEVTRDFADAGWTFVSRDVVTWLRSASLAEDVERLKLRAVSAFEHMSDEGVAEGFARVEAALPSLGDGPQYETSEMLVFQR
jgi:hypothetical protein